MLCKVLFIHIYLLFYTPPSKYGFRIDIETPGIMTPPRPNSFQSNNNPKHFPTYPEKILKVKIKADLKVGLTLTKGKIALHHFLSLCTSGHHCVISVFVLTHTLCKCSSPVLRDMCGDSSSQIQACTCCLFLISTAFPTNSVMADRLINIKVTAPG